MLVKYSKYILNLIDQNDPCRLLHTNCSITELYTIQWYKVILDRRLEFNVIIFIHDMLCHIDVNRILFIS